ncbi:phage holin family protein [Flavobacterium cyclinae]|uniref:phage holin family protein n=1 Tax=Flavobacterium cyclinae TaxID=2895947 RepID=UPI001E5C2008|nr:phage holin family protein [Flavobacterium cyclinae]UGS21466.1 phage holin family protein [Flavobacterium cyclinae]
MNLIIKLLLSAIIVFVLSYLVPGVTITSLTGALMVAVVLSLLNTFLKPILVFLTIPVTLFTLGLFLLVINAIIILICDYFIDEFRVDGFLTALIFSVLLSISQSVLNKIFVSED